MNDLITPKHADGFKTESPIRAFTEFRVSGYIAIGKGFRPSLSHLHTYLDAMQAKENWELVQIIQPETADPTIVFRRGMGTIDEKAIAESWPSPKINVDGVPVPVNQADDPVNPKHYSGTRCAEIGELLTANSYQVLKYNWRLGQKDDPCVELGKALWYLDREIALNRLTIFSRMPVADWFEERLIDADDYLRTVAYHLIEWNRGGDREYLDHLRKHLVDKRVRLLCGGGLAT